MTRLVSHHDHRGTGVGTLAKHLKHTVAGDRVQGTGGFIGQDQTPFPNDGACNGNTLLLSAGKLIHETVC